MKYLTLSIPRIGKIDAPTGLPSGLTGDISLSKIIGVGIEFILLAAIIFSLYILVRGGINIISSGGDKEKIARGRERVRYAIIGLIIVFMSFFFMNAIGSFLGIPLSFFPFS